MSSHDPFDTDAEVEEAAAQKQRQLSAAELKVNDFKWLMGSKRGRRIVSRLLDETGVFRTSFTGNSETFFREGQRNVGLGLMALINDNCGDQYVLMLNERREIT